MSTQQKTMAIKARVANSLRKEFHDLQVSKTFRGISKREKENIKDDKKIEIFDKIWDEVVDMHTELCKFKVKRREKRKVEEERIKRGVKSKKKTSKEEYLKRIHPVMEISKIA